MSLKVFDLQCGNGHIFEGWFSEANSFEKQVDKGLLSCPVCSDNTIERKLSAPRLNLGKKQPAISEDIDQAGQDRVGSGDNNAAMPAPQLAKFQAQVLQHMRQLVKDSEDVGSRFAQEALKIHHGEAQERAIRGTATAEERQELSDEGIAVMPVPDFLNDDQLQ